MRRLLLLLVLVSACRGGRLGANRGRDELARVNDEIIFADEVKRELQAGRMPGNTDPADDTSIQRAFDAVVNKKLLLQEAGRRHIVVSNDLVEKNFGRLKDEFPGGELDKVLEERKLTQATFKELTREQLLIAKLLREEVHARVVITDADAAEYFKTHPELAHQEEKVRCSQIVQRSPEDMQGVLEKMQKGMPFEEAASRFSITPEGKNGGDLGWISRGVMPLVIEEGCFGSELGKISKPVSAEFADDEDEQRTLKTTHVFKVVARKPAEDLPLERVREQVDARLRREREERAERDFLAALVKKAKVSVDNKRLSALGS